MMVGILLCMSMLVRFNVPSADTTPECRPVAAWSSVYATYGPSYDAASKKTYFTRDVDGVPGLYATGDRSSSLQACPVRSGERSAALGYVTFAPNGDAFGVAYSMRSRQTFATIVRLHRSADTIVVGEPVTSLDGDFYTSCPTISPDGQLMIFATDRPGSIGTTDLWQVERQLDGSFGQPVHCGSAVNSPYAETTPRLISSDTLMFSSNGFGGQGGMDVYISVFRNGMWQEPLPVEILNTPDDDTDAMRMPDGMFLVCRNSVQQRNRCDVWTCDPTP